MRTERFPLKLANEIIYLNISAWQNSKTVYINLHENEQTCVSAAKETLSNGPGILIELRSKGDRLITFKTNQGQFIFDPNRIFSPSGIKETLKEYSTWNSTAQQEVENFATQLVNKITSYNPELIVALHNTTGEYSIEGYETGGKYESDRDAIFINDSWHKGNFFFTTDKELFWLIKKGNYNVVLQNNRSVTDDGSLSVYCGRNKIKYINTEAIHGHLEEQKKMIAFIKDHTY
jgi:hypothetical protein